MAAWGQPDTAYWKFKIDRVEIIEVDVGVPIPPLGTEAPSNVINVPNRLKVRTHFRNEGPFSLWLHDNPSGKIEYHAENLETDLMSHPTPKTGWTVPGNGLSEHATFYVDSDEFTTSSAGSSSATNLREGTYMLTIIVSFSDPPAKQTVTAFNQAYFRIFPEV
jgi:hypothetical protein